MNTAKKHASLFELDGIPKMSQAIPLALQHVVAMIVGCVTPAIIISGAAGIDTADRVLLIQASLVVSALATLLQLFPIGSKNGFHLGSALPVILGVSFAYVPSMQAIAETGRSDRRRYLRDPGRSVHQKDSQILPSSDRRNSCIYHRPLTLSYCHQLHGQRNRPARLRLLAELDGCHLHSDRCNRSQPFCKGIFKTGFYFNRNDRRLHLFQLFRNGKLFQRGTSRCIPASRSHALWHRI